MLSSKIAGIGKYLPANVVTNQDLTAYMETSNEWIVERTGIQERRYAHRTEETTTTMAVEAAKIAIERAGTTAEEIDFIIFATLSPDYYFPGCGVLVQRAMGMKEIGALDIRNQCSGFVYALSVADQFIKTGMYKNILVIGSEKHSFGLDFSTRGRNVSVIFGDGAGAVVIRRADESETDAPGRVLSTVMGTDGTLADVLKVPGGGSACPITPENVELHPNTIHMEGRETFKHAVTRMLEASQQALEIAGLTAADVSLVIPHQANARIISAIAERLNLPLDRVFMNLDKYGNTSAATIPVALDEANKAGRLKKGDVVLLVAFGGGFTWASSVVRW